MPYSIRYSPRADGRNWAKVNKRTGRIVSRHRSKQKAQASIRAYYANNEFLTLNATLLRRDPTRTTLIRKAFMADMRRRFARLIADIKDFMVEKDALGLGERRSFIALSASIPLSPLDATEQSVKTALARQSRTGQRFVSNIQPREFEFRSDPQKLTAFQDWFREKVETNVFRPDPGTPAGTPWTTKYVGSSYKMGKINAYLASKREGLLEASGVPGLTQEQFLRSSFAQPETLKKVQLLATRSFEELKGVTSTMSSRMNRILAQGLVDGVGPREIAKDMTTTIANLTSTRALVIARTETIYAHAEGQLDAYQELGIDKVGVKAEWSTAGDDRVCPECADMEGEVFDMKDAHGLIPLHPSCRCSWIPFTEEAEKKAKEEAKKGHWEGNRWIATQPELPF